MAFGCLNDILVLDRSTGSMSRLAILSRHVYLEPQGPFECIQSSLPRGAQHISSVRHGETIRLFGSSFYEISCVKRARLSCLSWVDPTKQHVLKWEAC